MPVKVTIRGLGERVLRPTAAWQRLEVPLPPGADIAVDENFYVLVRNVGAPSATR
jgi:hypothetical protein